jgi:putative intracellular protease/amidase
MNILIVLTSHSELGNTGQKTGFWIEELAAPYYIFKEANSNIVIASPSGGRPPVDPKSDLPENQTAATIRFAADAELNILLNNSHKLADMRESDFDAIFYPGGHGPMWDLVHDADSIKLLEAFWLARKPVGAVCHAPAVFLNAFNSLGQSILKDRNVTGFSNSEEKAAGLEEIVPFSLEDELVKKDAIYSKSADWEPHIVTDGLLITGQNPASSAVVAEEIIKILNHFSQLEVLDTHNV